jgi:FkbM family methyltransferase
MIKKFLNRELRVVGLYEMIKDWFSIINPKSIRQRQEMLKFYGQFIKKDILVFDIGANMGNKTSIFLELGATVVAVEPQDICIKRLRRKFKNNNKVVLIQKALGEKEGKAEMMISNCHTVSSLSKEWIKSVKESGRCRDCKWNKTMLIPITTLDKLIEKYGKPDFCKIDVEGYEYNVLKGLSQPINIISFEFIPEFISSAINSIKYLSSFGNILFNYSVGESMRLALSKWVKPEELIKILISLPDKRIFGDVYAKFIGID